MNNKGFAPIIAIIIAVVIIAGGVGSYLYIKIKNKSSVLSPSNISTSTGQNNLIATSTSATTTQSTVISPTTKTLDKATMQLLSSVSSDSSIYTFNGTTTQLDSLVPGDIIVFGVSNKTPYGTLRKVQLVTKVGVGAGIQVKIQTTQATLEEAVPKGSFEASGTLTPANVTKIVIYLNKDGTLKDSVTGLKFHADDLTNSQIQLTVTQTSTGNSQKTTLTLGNKVILFGHTLTLTNISKIAVGTIQNATIEITTNQ